MADLVRPGRAGLLPRAARRARQHEGGPRSEYLAFALGGDPYAAPVSRVREILKPPPLTPVPRAPRDVLGIVSVRGQLTTILDLRRRLRLVESVPTRRARILLVEGPAGETLGLLVDEVLQVFRFTEAEIEPAASALGADAAAYIAGIARPASSTRVVAAAVPLLAPPAEAAVIILLDLTAVLA
jgi:purine-binding chemotaxis protein CheW